MANLINCRRCGRMYQQTTGETVCRNCTKEDEEIFLKVKQFIRDNPHVSLIEVAEACEIKVERIKHYLRDGRLEIEGNNPNLVIDCEKCGASIKSGKYCKDCVRTVGNNLKGIAGHIENDKKAEEKDKKIGFRHLKN